jgi:uncharacterized membrane protein YgcG
MNRQINERLRALMAAYKTLGGSFTGDLTVDPAHHRDLRQHPAAPKASDVPPVVLSTAESPGSDRARRVRDAVEAALSDIILLGTEEQVRLAASAANELATGKLVETQALVVSLRAFIREALDLDPIPAGLAIPLQGPARLTGSGGSGKAEKGEGRSGGSGGSGDGGGGGMSGGLGLGPGSHHHDSEEEEDGSGSSFHHPTVE